MSRGSIPLIDATGALAVALIALAAVAGCSCESAGVIQEGIEREWIRLEFYGVLLSGELSTKAAEVWQGLEGGGGERDPGWSGTNDDGGGNGNVSSNGSGSAALAEPWRPTLPGRAFAVGRLRIEPLNAADPQSIKFFVTTQDGGVQVFAVRREG